MIWPLSSPIGEMNQHSEQNKKFARLLVAELVDNDPSVGDVRPFHKRSGIDSSNLNNADEIWKIFVRYNLDTGGMKSCITEDKWNKLSNNSILKNRNKLLDAIEFLKNRNIRCYGNFSECCPITFKQKSGFSKDCPYDDLFNDCPVVAIIREIRWHRAHYKIAKIIVECAKRMLIEDEEGRKERNINNFVKAIFDKYQSSGEKWRTKATSELISRFDNIKGYGRPPKVIVWMLSDLSSPVHKVNHWPDVDLAQLVPVDTHVARLVVRFGFVKKGHSNEDIRQKLHELYPEEPRKLDFALYRLGAGLEENICKKQPCCDLCMRKIPKIFESCPSSDRRSF